MKLKKYSYVIVLIIALIIGINGVFAADSANCEAIFGSKTDPNSVRYFINEILQIPKIIVPIIIIIYGMIDFSKAVLASKEDEMRKAQTTFVKRVLIGIGVFLVPVIVDLLMGLADIALGAASSCSI